MDGFGIAPAGGGNAVSLAKKPQLDRIFAENAHTQLQASGLDVGLPEGQMGNSEVGHTNIGAGRVVFQDLPRINNAIADGSFFENAAYVKAMDDAKAGGKPLHILGLLSDGGVHSHINHIFAILDMAKMRGLEKVYVHCFLDGRDVPPRSAVEYVTKLRDKCASLGNAEIATIQGRFYGMDRDKRWGRVKEAYDMLVEGKGAQFTSALEAIQASYDADVTDEFIKPVVITEGGKPLAKVEEGDAVIFYNFRNDRARELTNVLTQNDMPEEGMHTIPLYYCCLTPYDASFTGLHILFDKEEVKDTLGEVVSKAGKSQLRIAETEKYAHVTFFFNGGRETPFENEDRILVPSPKVPTYDLQPEMSAFEVCDKCVERIESGAYDVIILNFANCDMVGHTGVLEAAVKAVETVDTCVGKVVDATLKMGGIAMVTADHGNAEVMLQPDGSPMTAHTTNLVPFILCGAGTQLRPGRLADIAPTILDVMGLAAPQEMDGQTLIVK